MKLPKKRRCVVAVQQPRRNQKRRGANVDGGGGEIVFSISFVISSEPIRKRSFFFQNTTIQQYNFEQIPKLSEQSQSLINGVSRCHL